MTDDWPSQPTWLISIYTNWIQYFLLKKNNKQTFYESIVAIQSESKDKQILYYINKIAIICNVHHFSLVRILKTRFNREKFSHLFVRRLPVHIFLSPTFCAYGSYWYWSPCMVQRHFHFSSFADETFYKKIFLFFIKSIYRRSHNRH